MQPVSVFIRQLNLDTWFRLACAYRLKGGPIPLFRELT